MNPLEFLHQLAQKPLQRRNGEHLKTMSFLAESTEIASYPIPIVLLTGTCGKGSTGIFLSSILEANGYQVGLVQSPHLISFSERIQINRNPLTEERILDKIAQLLPKFQASLDISTPNYNQVFLTTGLHLFKEQQVDIVIVESGIGGYADPCSYFEPILSIITNIHMDHQFLLGDNYESIAYDKTGIIKYRRPVITGTDIPNALEVIRREAELKHAPLFVLKEDFQVGLKNGEVIYEEEHMRLPLSIAHLPEFQWENAAVAIRASRQLQQLDFQLEQSLIIGGIEQAKTVGRFDIVSRSPLTIVDGAHNEEEIRRFCDAVRKLGCRNNYFIIGFSSNKDIRNMIRQLQKLDGNIILTPHSNLQRTPDKQELRKYAQQFEGNFHVACSVQEAYHHALEYARKEDGIFFTGSMFLAGDALQLFNHHG